MSYKQADIVELLSGGPPMTVKAEPDDSPNRNVVCVWFTASGEKKQDSFPLAMLKPSKAKNKGVVIG
jgi:uncharacterized protein YodC (DUF2158 family)